MRALIYLSGTLGASLFVMGYLFKITHWPMATLMLVVGLSLIGLVTIPLAGYYKYNKGKLESKKSIKDDNFDESLK